MLQLNIPTHIFVANFGCLISRIKAQFLLLKIYYLLFSPPPPTPPPPHPFFFFFLTRCKYSTAFELFDNVVAVVVFDVCEMLTHFSQLKKMKRIMLSICAILLSMCVVCKRLGMERMYVFILLAGLLLSVCLWSWWLLSVMIMIVAVVIKKTWCLTSTETVRLIRDGEEGRGVWRWGEREIIYLSVHCQHQNESCFDNLW